MSFESVHFYIIKRLAPLFSRLSLCQSKSQMGWVSSLGIGMMLGLVWAPCIVGPFGVMVGVAIKATIQWLLWGYF